MKLHIMIFDDDEDIRNMLETALVNKGYEVTTLSDPLEFPFFKNASCPCEPDEPCADILIADNVMPNIEGIDFFKQLKEKGCLPLIHENVAIMSGYLTIHYINELNNMGIYYFRKPFDLSEIYAWIEECKVRIEASRKASAE